MKRLVLAGTMAGLLLLNLSANDATGVLGQVLNAASTVNQQYAAALRLIAHNDPAGAEYLSDALERVNEARSNVRPGSPLQEYERLVRLLAKGLGDWRYSNAAPALWRVVQESGDALTRAEALIALGAVRAGEYGQRISLLLRDLNARPSADPEAGERLAFAAILALERMRYAEGFSAVFFAVDAWYSRRVKEQAERSLQLMLEDPTAELRAIIRLEENPRRLRALQFAVGSNLPAARKIELAAFALSVAVEARPRDRVDSATLTAIRILAMNSLVDQGDRSGNSAADIFAAYQTAERNLNVDERLIALKALGADRSAASARYLAQIIQRLNDDQLAGRVTEERNRLMQAALQNAAISGNRELFGALQMVSINEGWSNSIIRLANQALQALQS